MGVVSPNLKYNPCVEHTFTNPTSPFAPSTQLTNLPQDGFVKLCNDQSMLFHTTFEIPHEIQYIG